jgi:hypothetical protein
MTNLNARKRAIGIITGGRVDALEGAGLAVVERAVVEGLEAECERLRVALEKVKKYTHPNSADRAELLKTLEARE